MSTSNYEKILTGGFNSVNTRLSFDTETLLPNIENPNKGEEKYSTKRVISKILKLDENNMVTQLQNQYQPTSLRKKFQAGESLIYY